MANSPLTPAQIRGMFGANLKQLAQNYPSVSELSRQLGINRTQFNRYLASESFPRPDVLARICAFFDVDARILLEPIGSSSTSTDPISNPFLKNFVGAGTHDLPEDHFPSGFYRFSRRSFLDNNSYATGLVLVWRQGGITLIRGYEPLSAMRSQGLSTSPQAREFRGLVMQQENGIAILASRHHAMTCSFNYLSRVASFENNYWVGYATRTVPEQITGQRVARLAYEYLGTSVTPALHAARTAGLCTLADLPEFHRNLLRPFDPFK